MMKIDPLWLAFAWGVVWRVGVVGLGLWLAWRLLACSATN